MNLERTLVNAVREAGKLVRNNAFAFGNIEWKQKDDPVTDLDRAAERELRRIMSEAGTFNFVGEEYGREDNGAELTLYIDPIDGTKSFVRREFYSSLSVGVENTQGELVGGIVYDFMRDIMYVGVEGNCYVLHNDARHPLVQAASPFSKTRVAIDEMPALRERLADDPTISVVEKHGSIALAMAELAAGTYDANISGCIGKGNSYDVAGGLYLMQQAGVRVYDIKGKPFTQHNGSNGMIALRRGISVPGLEELTIQDSN